MASRSDVRLGVGTSGSYLLWLKSVESQAKRKREYESPTKGMAIPDKPEESGKSAVPEIYSLSLTLLSYPQLLPPFFRVPYTKNQKIPIYRLRICWYYLGVLCDVGSKKLKRDLRSPDSSAYFLGFINSIVPKVLGGIELTARVRDTL